MSLRLEDVGHTYAIGTTAAVVALQEVSLVVDPGELVLVVGETGSGKSTLLRLASGLLRPSTGLAFIDEVALDEASARGRVGLIFQDAESQLFADTVLDDVAFGPRNLGLEVEAAREAAREALHDVGLDAETYGSRSPFALSGGEARRAAIAGVLAMRPAYLLADEPTSGLDSSGREAVRSVLLESRVHSGVIIVTHSPEEFLAHADRVLILRDSLQVWSGETRTLLSDPSPLDQAGLAVPDVVAIQLEFARYLDRGVEPVLDPRAAAQWIARAGGWSA